MIAQMQDVLLVGMRKQARNDDSPAAQAIVEYVLRERRAVRALAASLHVTRSTSVPDWFAIANGVRCFARMRASGVSGGVLACARRDNEKRAVEWVHRRVPDIPWSNIEFDLQSPLSAMFPIASGTREYLGRVRDLSRALRGRYGQLAALRAIELLFYYDRLGRLLEETRCRVAVMSSYTNPWGIALNLAARQRGIPVVHVMHGAPITPLPALDYDIAIVNDPIAADTLRASGCTIERAIVKGARDPSPMPRSLPPQGFDAALCLSKEPVVSEAIAWIDLLRGTRFVRRVIVRPHPANLWRGVVDAVRKYRDGNVTLSESSLDDDMSSCFLMVAGNSSVHLEALSAGKLSIHAPGLDYTPPAALTFLGGDVVYRAVPSSPIRIGDVMDFYCSEQWKSRFARYANGHRSEVEADAEIREAVMDLFRRT